MGGQEAAAAGAAAAAGEEPNISKAPVNILFDTPSISKKDVWEIDLVKILDVMIGILERSEEKDLRVAGMAALSSAIIYRMKVESIFALQKAAAERAPPRRRTDVDIEIVGVPYRHEPTYPVTLDELLGILQNLIGSIANPKERAGSITVVPAEPDFKEYFISLESAIGRYEDLVASKLAGAGTGLLSALSAGLDPADSLKCFFAVLFMARDSKVELAQEGDDIRVTLAGRGGPAGGPA